MRLPTEIADSIEASCKRVLVACAREEILLDSNAVEKLERIACVSDFAMDVF